MQLKGSDLDRIRIFLTARCGTRSLLLLFRCTRAFLSYIKGYLLVSLPFYQMQVGTRSLSSVIFRSIFDFTRFVTTERITDLSPS